MSKRTKVAKLAEATDIQIVQQVEPAVQQMETPIKRKVKPVAKVDETPQLPPYIHMENAYRAAGWDVLKLVPFGTALLVCKRHTLDPNGVPGGKCDLHLVRQNVGPMPADFVSTAVALGAKAINANYRLTKEQRVILNFEDATGKRIAL